MKKDTVKRKFDVRGRLWSAQESAFLHKHYRNHTTTWICFQLGRTVYSVHYKASDLCIRKMRHRGGWKTPRRKQIFNWRKRLVPPIPGYGW